MWSSHHPRYSRLAERYGRFVEGVFGRIQSSMEEGKSSQHTTITGAKNYERYLINCHRMHSKMKVGGRDNFERVLWFGPNNTTVRNMAMTCYEDE